MHEALSHMSSRHVATNDYMVMLKRWQLRIAFSLKYRQDLVEYFRFPLVWILKHEMGL